MAKIVMVLGRSGVGKSASMRNLDEKTYSVVEVCGKPLPFRTAKKPYNTDDYAKISAYMHKTPADIIIIDDSQYLMANEFMRRSAEKSFDKFTEIGRNMWDIFNKASALPDDVRVYILSHIEESEMGKTKIKTIGKLLDEKITEEEIVTICLQTQVVNDNYIFMTKNNGHNTVKSPIGLFESEHIENDLKAVDDAIVEYYGLGA